MVSYEESRKKRMEENKKRMEQLNLHGLSLALNKPSPSKKLNLQKKAVSVTPTPTPVRRSSRTSDKPPPNYKEPSDSLLQLGGRRVSRGSSTSSKRTFVSDGDRQDAINRADQLESTLGSQYPTFVKPMLHSHVIQGFWLSFPNSFCKAHLPDSDCVVTLVDHNSESWNSNYLATKNGLSGGWRGFALDHHLQDGDALVFQLTKPNTFKVHIVRLAPSQQAPPPKDQAIKPTGTKPKAAKGRNK